ncbi:MAG TPA: hypothetical protein VGD98_07900 [Ktedonobacteraceae bacterium]
MEPNRNPQMPGMQGQTPPGWQMGQTPAGGPPAQGWPNPSSGYGAPTYSGSMQPGLAASVIQKTAKWTALPVISFWFKILAWISLVGGAIGFLISLVVGFSAAANPYIGGAGAGLGFVYGIFLLLGGAYGFLWNLFFSEMIGVFLAIEKNTRKE